MFMRIAAPEFGALSMAATRIALAALAILAYPLLAPLQGRPWGAAEIVGLAPDPTAIATLGLLILARGPLVGWLLVVPALWCLLAAATLGTMGAMQGWLPLVAVPIALYGTYAKR